MVTRRGAGKSFLALVAGLLIFVLLGALGVGAKLYRDIRIQRNNLQAQNQELSKQLTAYKADPNQAAQAKVDQIIAEVGKLYALPPNEKPTLATVNDKEASKKQYGTFFDKAENNDISLFYTKAKIAILYRPSTQQIINVSSVTVDDKPEPIPTPTTPTPTP